MSKTIVFVAGEGGHFNQCVRLINLLENSFLDKKIYILTDRCRNKLPTINVNIEVIEVGELRGKSGFEFMSAINHVFKVLSFFSKTRDVSLISTGPGIAIIPSLLARILGGKVVHIETWSRFYSKSLTAKFMYYLSNKFYIQNESLASLYKKAIYAGRL